MSLPSESRTGSTKYATRTAATKNAQKYAKDHDTWAAAEEPSTGSDSGWAIYASFEAGGVTASKVLPHPFHANPGTPPANQAVLCRRCGRTARADIHST